MAYIYAHWINIRQISVSDTTYLSHCTATSNWFTEKNFPQLSHNINKAVPACHESTEGSGCMATLILHLALDGTEWSASCPSCFTLKE